MDTTGAKVRAAPWYSCYQHFKSQSARQKKCNRLWQLPNNPSAMFFFFPFFFTSQINFAKAVLSYCIVIAFGIKYPFNNKLHPVLGSCCQGPGGVPSRGLKASSEHAAAPFPWGHGERGQAALCCEQSVGRVFSWAWTRPDLQPRRIPAPAPFSPRGCLLSLSLGPVLVPWGGWAAANPGYRPVPGRAGLAELRDGAGWPQREGTAVPCPDSPAPLATPWCTAPWEWAQALSAPEPALRGLGPGAWGLGCAWPSFPRPGQAACHGGPKAPKLPWLPGGAPWVVVWAPSWPWALVGGRAIPSGPWHAHMTGQLPKLWTSS